MFFLFNIILDSRQDNQARKEIKSIQIRKEEVELPICRRHNFIYRKSYRIQTYTLKTIGANKFSKTAGYKIKTQQDRKHNCLGGYLACGVPESQRGDMTSKQEGCPAAGEEGCRARITWWCGVRKSAESLANVGTGADEGLRRHL